MNRAVKYRFFASLALGVFTAFLFYRSFNICKVNGVSYFSKSMIYDIIFLAFTISILLDIKIMAILSSLLLLGIHSIDIIGYINFYGIVELLQSIFMVVIAFLFNKQAKPFCFIVAGLFLLENIFFFKEKMFPIAYFMLFACLGFILLGIYYQKIDNSELDKLLALKSKLDSGEITKEEFDREKAQLI